MPGTVRSPVRCSASARVAGVVTSATLAVSRPGPPSRSVVMQRTITRVLLVVFGLVEAVVGIWPLVSPIGFYQDFPGFRTGWVSTDGPFNEHLLRDFGGLNLGLAALLTG